MASKDDWLHTIDDRLGDQIESGLRARHRRRLRKAGWGAAIDPGPFGSWWAEAKPVHSGNQLEVLIDGKEAFAAMEEAILGARRSVHIANWHASPEFRLTRDPDGPVLRDLLADVAQRATVRLLLWAGPPLPAFQPTRRMVRDAQAEFVRDSVVRCELDSMGAPMECHHEKIVVIDDEVAFVGGLDFTALQGDRYDDPGHEPRAAMRWHDAAVRLRGPAVAEVGRHFAARWSEVTGETVEPGPAPAPAGSTDVQVLRTIPEGTYDFAPQGDFSVLQAYLAALRSAREFIYLENQFLWSPEIVDVLQDRLIHPPSDDFRILLVLPTRPSDGTETTRGQLSQLLNADRGANRILATTVVGLKGEHEEPPVYVHAKVGVIDDRWLMVGSANLNERSLFNDSEMTVLTDDRDLARRTRLRLWAEHTEHQVTDVEGSPREVIDTLWRPVAEEQARRAREGLPRTHRLSLLEKLSRRTDRLEGPVRGLLVDG